MAVMEFLESALKGSQLSSCKAGPSLLQYCTNIGNATMPTCWTFDVPGPTIQLLLDIYAGR
jgi:hypothetical protein